MYFNLSVKIGVNVSSLSAYLNFTPEPFMNFMDGPHGPRSNYTVNAMKYNAEGVGPLIVSTIPTPMPPLAFNKTGETYNFTKPNKLGENIQTANNQCFPMSIANSLQYLENRYGIPVSHDHKKGLKGDDSLVGKLDEAANRSVRSRADGDPVGGAQMLEGKFKYLSENGLANTLIHRHQDEGILPEGNFTRHGITSKDESVGGKVTFDWICEQVKNGEDVEIGFLYDGGGGHFVRVFGCGKTNGVPWLRYKHDAMQTNVDPTDTMGLEEPEVFVQDTDNDGTLNFGSKNKEIVFAISESPKPQYAPPVFNIIDPPLGENVCVGKTTGITANITIDAINPFDTVLENVSVCINITCVGGYVLNEKHYVNLSGISSATVEFTVTPPMGQCNVMGCVDCDDAIPELNETDNCGNTTFNVIQCQAQQVPISPLSILAVMGIIIAIAVARIRK